MNSTHPYDYIIAGAGCAGLSLLMRMIKNSKLQNKRILLIEKEPKNTPDRTWCFWEQGPGFFEEIVYRKWNNIRFNSHILSRTMEIEPYHYKMIRGLDFYNYCFDEIRKHDNIEILYGEIDDLYHNKNSIRILQAGNGSNEKVVDIQNTTVFSSIYHPSSRQSGSIRLLQHFKGWTIETSAPAFNPIEATIMDFRVSQELGTTFAYVLPLTSTSALVEYTLFTKKLLRSEKYDEGLNNYIRELLKIDNFKITGEEFGVIQMTNERLDFYRNGIFHIGTAGGQTKASSGYTFQFIQKMTQTIIDHLVEGRSLRSIRRSPARFRFYDNTLLDILYHGKLRGADIFSTLFQKNKPQRMLRFLDNESTIGDELGIISTLPTWPFLKAALRQL